MIGLQLKKKVNGKIRRVVRVVIWSSAKAFTQVRILYSPQPVKDTGGIAWHQLGRWFNSTNCDVAQWQSERFISSRLVVQFYPSQQHGDYGVKVARKIVVLLVWVRNPLFTPKESCLSGRKGRFAKPLYGVNLYRRFESFTLRRNIFG